jgi:anti-anti-sigma regulatory factor
MSLLQPHVRVDQVGRSLWVVELHGEHDLATVPDLRAELADVCAPGRAVIVDLSRATFIDSSILSELIQAQLRADAAEGERFAVVAPPDGLPARVVGMASMGAHLVVYADRARAASAIGALDATG